MFTKTNEFICLSIRQSIRQHAIEHFLIKDVHKQKKKMYFGIFGIHTCLYICYGHHKHA